MTNTGPDEGVFDGRFEDVVDDHVGMPAGRLDAELSCATSRDGGRVVHVAAGVFAEQVAVLRPLERRREVDRLVAPGTHGRAVRGDRGLRR